MAIEQCHTIAQYGKAKVKHDSVMVCEYFNINDIHSIM